MSKLKKVIKKVIGQEKIVNPMIDQYNYCKEYFGWSGGALQSKNILIVTNINVINEVQSLISVENANVSIFSIDKILSEGCSSIASASSDNVGPFTNIINLIKDNSQNTNEEEIVKISYKLLQIECDYLINKPNCGVISSGIITNNLVMSGTIESLFEGLSLALGRHNIIENGLIADLKTSITDIVNALTYLNSKYGYILAGEVLILSEDKSNGEL